MAAIVTGLIPIQQTAVDATIIYKCRSLWFGLLCIRLVMLFLAELPFTKLDADIACDGTTQAQKRSSQMKIDGELEAQGKEEAQVVRKDTRGKTVI
eukprot:superscaffoldBa00000091_g1350